MTGDQKQVVIFTGRLVMTIASILAIPGIVFMAGIGGLLYGIVTVTYGFSVSTVGLWRKDETR